MMQPWQPVLIDLADQVELISYHDKHSGFAIALEKVVGRRHLVTVVGNLMAPAAPWPWQLKRRAPYVRYNRLAQQLRRRS